MRVLPYIFLLLIVAGCSLSAPEPSPSPPASAAPAPASAPSGEQILAQVVANLPQEPVTISGELTIRKRRGVVVRELRFDMDLKWGGEPSEAGYLITDTIGKPLERMILTRKRGGEAVAKYYTGDPLVEAEVPDLFEPIQDSDISWTDLTLAFLWWKGGKVVGGEEVKGRECYVIDVAAPARKAGADGKKVQYAGVRVWIDRQAGMLLKAEGFDAAGKVARSLWVKSFKKINGQWMIRDMEIQGPDPAHRTKLVIREVNAEKLTEGE